MNFHLNRLNVNLPSHAKYVFFLLDLTNFRFFNMNEQKIHFSLIFHDLFLFILGRNDGFAKVKFLLNLKLRFEH